MSHLYYVRNRHYDGVQYEYLVLYRFRNLNRILLESKKTQFDFIEWVAFHSQCMVCYSNVYLKGEKNDSKRILQTSKKMGMKDAPIFVNDDLLTEGKVYYNPKYSAYNRNPPIKSVLIHQS